MNNTHSDGEDLRLLYEVTVTDLTYFKAQQWSVANYCMLSYAALVGTAQLLKPARPLERVVLVLLAAATCLSVLFVLGKLQTSIRIRQSRLDSIREKLSDAFQLAWASEYKPKERLHSIHLLFAAVPMALLLAAWLIGFRL
jgi:hypothetical protein